MADESEAPGDSLRARASGSRWKLWFLLDADRRLVSGLLVLLVFAGLVLAGVLLPGVASRMRSSDPVETLFQAFTTATITGVTLVLTLNQLVLSQELGAVGDQRDRMSGAMSFRSDVADVVDAPVSPARPAQVLRAMVQYAGDRADAFRDAVDASGDGGDGSGGGSDDDLQGRVRQLTDSVTENADEVADELDGAQFGEFDVISAALDFNYSWKLYAARRLRTRYRDDLSEAALQRLDDLVEVLELFGPAREHFKTLYFQWELIGLSRAVLATSVPALVVSAAMVAFFDPGAVIGALGGVHPVVVVVSLAATAATVPFLVLLAYVLRIATVTKRTLSIGPFILRSTDDVDEVEWEG